MSACSWILLALPALLISGHGEDGDGFGLIAIAGLFLWPGLVIMNCFICCRSFMAVVRPRPLLGKIGAVLATIHAGVFVGVSAPHILSFL